jgi:hypothetical protein
MKLTPGHLYYIIEHVELFSSIKFVIGNKQTSIYGFYNYDTRYIYHVLRLVVFKDPIIYETNDFMSNNCISICSDLIQSYEIKIDENIETNEVLSYLLNIDNLIKIFNKYKDMEIKEYLSYTQYIIHGDIKYIPYKIQSLLQLCINSNLIHHDELLELSNIYYNLNKLI